MDSFPDLSAVRINFLLEGICFVIVPKVLPNLLILLSFVKGWRFLIRELKGA